MNYFHRYTSDLKALIIRIHRFQIIRNHYWLHVLLPFPKSWLQLFFLKSTKFLVHHLPLLHISQDNLILGQLMSLINLMRIILIHLCSRCSLRIQLRKFCLVKLLHFSTDFISLNLLYWISCCLVLISKCSLIRIHLISSRLVIGLGSFGVVLLHHLLIGHHLIWVMHLNKPNLLLNTNWLILRFSEILGHLHFYGSMHYLLLLSCINLWLHRIVNTLNQHRSSSGLTVSVLMLFIHLIHILRFLALKSLLDCYSCHI